MAIWIGDKDGTEGTRIAFDGQWSPFPVPTPVNDELISEHQMLAGASGPGSIVVQDFGSDSGVLFFRWKSLHSDKRNALRAFYELWVAGERPPVRVHINGVTWLCAWKRLRDPRRPMRPERYEVQADFRILEVVT